MEWFDDDSDGYFNNSDNDDLCFGVEDNNNAEKAPEKHYTILTVSDIQHRQNEEISRVTSVVPVSESEASDLLYHYKWNTSQLLDQWFTSEETVRNKVGLYVKVSKSPKNRKYTCEICFEENLSINKVFSTSCDEHWYCKTCWRKYIKTSINNKGLGCLSLKCPDLSCTGIVGHGMIVGLTKEKYKTKYFSYLTRSYVEGKSGTIKWCPAPGCDRAVEIEHGRGYDIECDCSHCFCWNCGEEPHRPVECKVVGEWIMKNTSEAENTTWILAYTKPCPKCKRPIQKNHGCNHMTCGPPCRYEFCWLCLRDYRTYGTCNGFNYKDRENTNEQNQKNLARKHIEKYTHYYERWASNHKSREKAIQGLGNLQTHQLPNLSVRVSEPETRLEFIVQAWKQIIECRRVLKWTYAYGYFLLEHEEAKRQLFEYLQGEAEAGLERLHRCAEIELSHKFLGDDDGEGDDDMQGEFGEFRKKLIGLTQVTGTYFENLVQGLENRLSEVVSEGPSRQTTAEKTSKVSSKRSSKVVRHRKRSRLT